jgi:hypothetical protein
MNITHEQIKKIKYAMYLAEWFVGGDTCKEEDKADDKITLTEARKTIADILNQDLVEEAIDHLCKFVQNRLGVDRGDFAGIYWADDVPRDVIASYINGERGMK